MSQLYLAHHGIKGQKWGIRRYQDKDGSYKAGAEGRYDSSKSNLRAAKKEYKAKMRQAHKSGQHFKNYAMLHPIATSVKKGSEKYEINQKNGRQWLMDMNSASRAKAKYKEAKKEYKEAKKARKAPEEHISKYGSTKKASTATHSNTKKGESYIQSKRNVKIDKKIAKLREKKDFDVKSFDAIKSDMAYTSGPRKGQVYYSVADAKRDQKITAEAYDKRIKKLQDKKR